MLQHSSSNTYVGATATTTITTTTTMMTMTTGHRTVPVSNLTFAMNSLEDFGQVSPLQLPSCNMEICTYHTGCCKHNIKMIQVYAQEVYSPCIVTAIEMLSSHIAPSVHVVFSQTCNLNFDSGEDCP